MDIQFMACYQAWRKRRASLANRLRVLARDGSLCVMFAPDYNKLESKPPSTR